MNNTNVNIKFIERLNCVKSSNFQKNVCRLDDVMFARIRKEIIRFKRFIVLRTDIDIINIKILFIFVHSNVIKRHKFDFCCWYAPSSAHLKSWTWTQMLLILSWTNQTESSLNHRFDYSNIVSVFQWKSISSTSSSSIKKNELKFKRHLSLF